MRTATDNRRQTRIETSGFLADILLRVLSGADSACTTRLVSIRSWRRFALDLSHPKILNDSVKRRQDLLDQR